MDKSVHPPAGWERDGQELWGRAVFYEHELPQPPQSWRVRLMTDLGDIRSFGLAN